MPKYGASRLMSQSARVTWPSSSAANHSRILFSTSGCSRPGACVHSCRKSTQRCELSWKKWCALDFSTGVAPDSADTGFLTSVGEYTAPQLSQLSPYWSLAPQFGHSPLM